MCTNAQALWREPQTNRTVKTERRENKTPKNKRPLPQSPLPLSGKGKGAAHAKAEEAQRTTGCGRAARRLVFHRERTRGKLPSNPMRGLAPNSTTESGEMRQKTPPFFIQIRPFSLKSSLVFHPPSAASSCPRFDLAERREMPNFAKHSFALDTGRTLKTVAL